MVEDTSPENLRKFLNSDDPAMARMGISMAKAIGIEVTFKDLEHFLYRGNIETARNGAMLMEEAGIPVVKIIDELIQNIEKNKDNPMYELIEILPTFGKAALEPLFNLFSSVIRQGQSPVKRSFRIAKTRKIASRNAPHTVHARV